MANLQEDGWIRLSQVVLEGVRGNGRFVPLSYAGKAVNRDIQREYNEHWSRSGDSLEI